MIAGILLAVGVTLLYGAYSEYYEHLGLCAAGERSMPWGRLVCVLLGGTMLTAAGAVMLLEKK